MLEPLDTTTPPFEVAELQLTLPNKGLDWIIGILSRQRAILSTIKDLEIQCGARLDRTKWVAFVERVRYGVGAVILD